MKHLTIALALAVAALSGAAQANSHKEAPDMAAASAPMMGKQQTKMAHCNDEAGDMKGEDRKAYMKKCLSAKKPTAQQEKMKTCNAEAAGKSGEERKAFMKSCLSN